MTYEYSCGAVVFTMVNGAPHYLLIRQNDQTEGCHGFPKGHMEPGEDECATALREIREEVGVSATILNGFRAEEHYPLPNKPGVVKQVVYFLAEFSGQEIHHQVEELTEAYLLPYEEALQMLTFEEAKQILIEAHHFLSKAM